MPEYSAPKLAGWKAWLVKLGSRGRDLRVLTALPPANCLYGVISTSNISVAKKKKKPLSGAALQDKRRN